MKQSARWGTCAAPFAVAFVRNLPERTGHGRRASACSCRSNFQLDRDDFYRWRSGRSGQRGEWLRRVGSANSWTEFQGRMRFKAVTDRFPKPRSDLPRGPDVQFLGFSGPSPRKGHPSAMGRKRRFGGSHGLGTKSVAGPRAVWGRLRGRHKLTVLTRRCKLLRKCDGQSLLLFCSSA